MAFNKCILTSKSVEQIQGIDHHIEGIGVSYLAPNSFHWPGKKVHKVVYFVFVFVHKFFCLGEELQKKIKIRWQRIKSNRKKALYSSGNTAYCSTVTH